MKVMVTGANGFVGSHVCVLLEQNGHEVVRAVRQAGQENETAVGELDGSTNWTEALQGVDVVVHTAARVHVLHEKVADPDREFRTINVEATMHLARSASAAGVRRLVFLSTIGVLGNFSDEPFTEDADPNPSNAYSSSKFFAEQRLLNIARETSLEIVIIRPPLVYGPCVKANFYRLMHSVYKERYLPFGRVHNKRDFVSVTNLCDLIRCCLDHPAAAGELFLVADGQAISTPELIRELAQLMDKKPRLLYIPIRFLKRAAICVRKERLYDSVCRSLRVDITKAYRLLGWNPPQHLHDGLKHTVAWYIAQAEGKDKEIKP